jgi:t-SNARE complex subunit (syntaxin)
LKLYKKATEKELEANISDEHRGKIFSKISENLGLRMQFNGSTLA